MNKESRDKDSQENNDIEIKPPWPRSFQLPGIFKFSISKLKLSTKFVGLSVFALGTISISAYLANDHTVRMSEKAHIILGQIKKFTSPQFALYSQFEEIALKQEVLFERAARHLKTAIALADVSTDSAFANFHSEQYDSKSLSLKSYKSVSLYWPRFSHTHWASIPTHHCAALIRGVSSENTSGR